MRSVIQNNYSLIVGLTGSIASGKSILSEYFGKLSAYIIDADKIYQELTMPNSSLVKLIAYEFGSSVINEDGSLNRKYLSSLVFSSEEYRLRLNRITHPVIIDAIIEKINEASDKKIIIVSAPLLIESNFLNIFDYLIVIDSKPELQIERLMHRDKISSIEAQKRIRAQLSSNEKIKYADFVIDNNKSLEYAYQQAKAIYKKLLKHWEEKVIGLKGKD